MDEDVITLSSDEDGESSKSSETPALKNVEINECINFFKEKLRQNIASMVKISNETKTKVSLHQEEHEARPTPEVVDLVDCTDKSPENCNSDDDRKSDKAKNHSETNGTDAEINFTCSDTLSNHHLADDVVNAEMPNDKSSNLNEPLVKIESVDEISPSKISQANLQPNDIAVVKTDMTENNCQNAKISNKSLNMFKEFLDYCGSLEENPKHREKLIEKLQKYFAESEPEYVRSKEFRNLIKKCRYKTNVDNLYLVVKTVADELKLHKKVQNRVKDECAEAKEKCEVEGETNDSSDSLRQEKRLAKVQKIIKKLNKLGNAIRELERQEVDLSDEEDSVYLKLQRFRERFWVIYKKLCKYTNDVDVDFIFHERIHFAETKYQAINRCIEKWLNKTRCFPDFADILKILETHSTELNLPSNKDSLRATAIEIFQKVGDVLQRKRKYDLWNSFSDFLEDTEDPAVNNPEMEKIFRENYELRVKKEQEIYQLYAERQEKESLQPKEVLEEDAYRSPESGNEEEEEIINIETSLGEKLLNDVCLEDEGKQMSDSAATTQENASLNEKESKNNFKNCKSLKWRSEKKENSKNESSDNSSAEANVDYEENATEPEEKDSSPELILIESDNQKSTDTKSPREVRSPTQATSKKRSLPSATENCWGKKRSIKEEDLNNMKHPREDGESLSKAPIFDVGYCHIVTNDNFKERRKVFRDLTNLNRLMKKPGMRDKMAGLFTPTFLYSRCSLKKETPWKKRLKINLREIKPKNQKCALNEEEKTREKISRSTPSRDSKNMDSKNNAGSGREGADFSGQGNGQEEDNNDKGDENRKNGKVEEENDDHEEDDDEEKEDENAEAGEHSSNTQKTEKDNENSLEPTGNENHTLDEADTLKVEKDETCEVEDAVGEDTGQQSNEKEENEPADEGFENRFDYDDESGRDIGFKSKDSEDAEEFEDLKNSLEPICVLKEGDASDVIEKANNEAAHQKPEDNTWNVCERKKFKSGPFSRSKLKIGTGERSRNETHNQKRLPMTPAWTPPSEIYQPKSRKMSASDEERVKRFLMHSPSSISITPPKKLTLTKPPSQSALQALATLRNLKGISATIVKGKPKKEDVLGGQSRRSIDQSSPVTVKRRRPDLPVISNVQSANTLTPKIVTVHGNVSGFENLWPEMKNNGNANPDSSPIRISKVWGSLPATIVQGNPSHYPGCSSRKSNPGTSNQVRKKNSKKQVEYVVLD